jgi:hypothetical protein
MAPPLSAFVWLRVTTITFVYAESQDKPIPDFEEPSPLLLERAMFDVDQHRFRVANLTLQTLINTYPESEYASKAKQAWMTRESHRAASRGLLRHSASTGEWTTRRKGLQFPDERI